MNIFSIIFYYLISISFAQSELQTNIESLLNQAQQLNKIEESLISNKCSEQNLFEKKACPQLLIPSKINEPISSPALLILTHPTKFFDVQSSAKKGINNIESWAKENTINSLILHDRSNQENYYYSNCNPGHIVYSENGELNIPIKTKKIYLAGGYYHACLTHTVEGLITRENKEDIDITFVSDGIYVDGTFLQRSDATYSREVKKYMKSNKQEYIPLNIIIEKIMADRFSKEGVDYLKDYLRLSFVQYGYALSKYRQVISISNKEEIIIESPDKDAPTLRLNIVTSENLKKE